MGNYEEFQKNRKNLAGLLTRMGDLSREEQERVLDSVEEDEALPIPEWHQRITELNK